MPRTATVKRLTFPEGRRVLAISDIHGNLPFLKGVLAAAHYGPDDILVLVGDLVEKGPDSLTTLRFIMELAERNTVYGLRGNCDNLVSEFVAARGEEERFYRHYVDVWRDRCLLVQMGHAAGFETRGPEELPALREVVRARFGPELAFLEAMPEILLTPDYLFVHGGVADEAHLEGLDAWKCMKNDDFLSQGHSFRRWCIVGHWPVTLYHPHVPSASSGAAYRLHRRRLLPQGGRPAQRPGAAGKARRGLLLVRLRRPAYRHRPGPPGPVGGLGKHPLGPQRPGGAGAGGGALPLPPPGDRPGLGGAHRVSLCGPGSDPV